MKAGIFNLCPDKEVRIFILFRHFHIGYFCIVFSKKKLIILKNLHVMKYLFNAFLQVICKTLYLVHI
jgi:hypothetical protein